MKWTQVLLVCFVVMGCVQKRDYADSRPYEGKPMRHGFWFGKKSEDKKAASSIDPETKARGQKIYETQCMACHGPQGKGDGPLSQFQRVPPANLVTFAAKFPNANFFIQVSEGKGAMPGWNDLLSEEQISDLSKYIHTLYQK